MVFTGKPAADKEERPTISKARGHESFNSRKSLPTLLVFSGLIAHCSICALLAFLLSQLQPSRQLSALGTERRLLDTSTTAVYGQHDHVDTIDANTKPPADVITVIYGLDQCNQRRCTSAPA